MKNVMKVIGIITAILGGIGTIILTIEAADFGPKGFGFSVFLISSMNVCVYVSIFFSFYVIINNQDKMMKRLDDLKKTTGGKKSIAQIMKEEKPEESKPVEVKVIPLLKNKTYPGGPIVLNKAELIVEGGKVNLNVIMMNISESNIMAVKLIIKTMNALGEIIDDSYGYVYSDINIQPNGFFGKDVIIPMSSVDVRNAEIQIQRVLFSDGSKWESLGAEMIDQEIKKFDFINHEYDINSFKNAKEIYEYLKDLNYQGDAFFTDEILPTVSKRVFEERMYGNMKEDTIKTLKIMCSRR